MEYWNLIFHVWMIGNFKQSRRDWTFVEMTIPQTSDNSEGVEHSCDENRFVICFQSLGQELFNPFRVVITGQFVCYKCETPSVFKTIKIMEMGMIIFLSMRKKYYGHEFFILPFGFVLRGFGIIEYWNFIFQLWMIGNFKQSRRDWTFVEMTIPQTSDNSEGVEHSCDEN